MNFEIKKIADLEKILGKSLTRNILNWAKNQQGLMAKPRRVEVHTIKPEFYLSDGDTLHALAVDLASGDILGERYCGSGDTAINHPEQFDNTYTAPKDKAMFFIRSYWNGRNHSWIIHCVVANDNLQKMLKA